MQCCHWAQFTKFLRVRPHTLVVEVGQEMVPLQSPDKALSDSTHRMLSDISGVGLRFSLDVEPCNIAKTWC